MTMKTNREEIRRRLDLDVDAPHDRFLAAELEAIRDRLREADALEERLEELEAEEDDEDEAIPYTRCRKEPHSREARERHRERLDDDEDPFIRAARRIREDRSEDDEDGREEESHD